LCFFAGDGAEWLAVAAGNWVMHHWEAASGKEVASLS
jgi:hypothetical protein